MPCDSRVTVSVNLSAADRELLFKVLMGLGWQPREISNMIQVYVPEFGAVTITGGKLNIGTYSYLASEAKAEELANKIRRAYSAEVVKSQAKKFGWQLKQTADNKFKAIRRY